MRTLNNGADNGCLLYMSDKTEYKSRCAFCGEKTHFVIQEGDIICPKCNKIVGIQLDSELDITLLCSWNVNTK